MKLKFFAVFIYLCFSGTVARAQTGSWKLWAKGLPQGAYPRMIVAPNHDIYFALLGSPTKLGIVFKANTQDTAGTFSELPQIPRPVTIQNNIVALGVNKNSEPLAGIYRTNMSDPWLFCFNSKTQTWDTAKSDLIPTLGGQCIATSKKGIIYVGTRWAYIYKSTDNGKTFKAIDDAKILAKNYPCYYPSFLNGSINDGSVFTISIDNNDRVYAGTETAGIIYSDDEGETWRPADLFACKKDKNNYDTLSPMGPLAKSGNVAGIGFTKDNNVVWSGNDMWYYGWKNKLGFANMKDSTVSQLKGLPDYLVQTGQQISKIVTTNKGTMFFHSGSSNGASQIGIYKSSDGINWELFNTGITGMNDGQSQGSLAVDGNKVFMATRDGQVWMYDESPASGSISQASSSKINIYPNPAISSFSVQNLKGKANCKIINSQGQVVLVKEITEADNLILMDGLTKGVYGVIIHEGDGKISFGRVLK